MSNSSQRLSPEQPRTPTVVTQILTRVGTLLDELDALIKKDLPAGDLFTQSLSALSAATSALMVKDIELQAIIQRIEQEERNRETAANTLGDIPTQIESNDVPAFLRVIAQQLHQLQGRMLKFETRQEEITKHIAEQREQSMGLAVACSFEPVHTSLEEHKTVSTLWHTAFSERLTQVQNKQIDSEKRICTAVYSSLDEILKFFPVQKSLNNPRKRSFSKNTNSRATSATHDRKISISQSMVSARSFGRRTFDKTAAFFRQASKSLDIRRPSTSDALERPTFQYLGAEQLSFVPEQEVPSSSPIRSHE